MINSKLPKIDQQLLLLNRIRPLIEISTNKRKSWIDTHSNLQTGLNRSKRSRDLSKSFLMANEKPSLNQRSIRQNKGSYSLAFDK